MKSADLHLHTLYSDGTYTPEELIKQAVKVGLSCIAVTDHDTITGIKPVTELGKRKGVEVIPGIELSSEDNGMEIHILGYFVDYKDKAFTATLDTLQKNRIERIYKILDKLREMGIDLDPKKVFGIAKKGTVGRLHVARAMLAEGFIRSLYEAFHKYIGNKGPAYVAGFKLSPRQAIDLIKSTGGTSILAHPYTLNHDELIPEFVKAGLAGLEVYYPEHSQADVNFYLGLAKKYNLLVTGGSDCHGKAKSELKIGRIKIPYELVEKLKAAKIR